MIQVHQRIDIVVWARRGCISNGRGGVGGWARGGRWARSLCGCSTTGGGVATFDVLRKASGTAVGVAGAFELQLRVVVSGWMDNDQARSLARTFFARQWVQATRASLPWRLLSKGGRVGSSTYGPSGSFEFFRVLNIPSRFVGYCDKSHPGRSSSAYIVDAHGILQPTSISTVLLPLCRLPGMLHSSDTDAMGRMPSKLQISRHGSP